MKCSEAVPRPKISPVVEFGATSHFLGLGFGSSAAILTAPLETRIIELGTSRRVGELNPRSARPIPWLCGRKTSSLIGWTKKEAA